MSEGVIASRLAVGPVPPPGRGCARPNVRPRAVVRPSRLHSETEGSLAGTGRTSRALQKAWAPSRSHAAGPGRVRAGGGLPPVSGPQSLVVSRRTSPEPEKERPASPAADLSTSRPSVPTKVWEKAVE